MWRSCRKLSYKGLWGSEARGGFGCTLVALSSMQYHTTHGPKHIFIVRVDRSIQYSILSSIEI